MNEEIQKTVDEELDIVKDLSATTSIAIKTMVVKTLNRLRKGTVPERSMTQKTIG